MGQSIYAEFRARSLERREDIAIIQVEGKKHSSVTYGKMLDEIEAVSIYLSTLGLSEGQTVAILSENRYEWMVCYFAAVSLGLIAVPLDPQSQSSDLSRALKHAAVQVVFASESFAGSIEAFQKERIMNSPDWRPKRTKNCIHRDVAGGR